MLALADNIPVQWLPIVGRFSLVAYIILFFAWERFRPSRSRFLRLGDGRKTLRFPLIWWGMREYVWRFTLIFCALWLIVTAVFWSNGILSDFFLYGFLFAVVNAILEEILWRGLVLGRAIDWVGEKQGLLFSSLAFGFYHLSLGFSIWACLIFAVGGFYLGGVAIRSGGLFAPVVMHFFVNIAFVSFGLIF